MTCFGVFAIILTIYGVYMDIDELCLNMANKLLENKATNIVVLNTEKRSKIAKRMIICSCENNQQTKTTSCILKEEYKNIMPCLHTDGIFKGVWIVLDFKGVIVHIFTKEARCKFNIEKLWKDNKNFIEIK